MRLFRRPRGRHNEVERLRAAIQAEACHRWKLGELTRDQYAEIIDQTENRPVALYMTVMTKRLIPWEDIFNWVSEHWQLILQIIGIILLVKDENDAGPDDEN